MKSDRSEQDKPKTNCRPIETKNSTRRHERPLDEVSLISLYLSITPSIDETLLEHKEGSIFRRSKEQKNPSGRTTLDAEIRKRAKEQFDPRLSLDVVVKNNSFGLSPK